MGLIKFQILVKKLPHLSDQEFHDYWSNEHPKLWLSLKIVKTNIIDYSQFHVDKKLMAGVEPLGLPLGEWDGIMSVTAESLEKLMEVYQDEEYLRIVVPDEKKLIHRETAIMMIGEQVDKKINGVNQVLVD